MSVQFKDHLADQNSKLIAKCADPKIYLENREYCKRLGGFGNKRQANDEHRAIQTFLSQSIIELLTRSGLTQVDGRPYTRSTPKGFLQYPQAWVAGRGLCLHGWPYDIPQGSVSAWPISVIVAMTVMIKKNLIQIERPQHIAAYGRKSKITQNRPLQSGKSDEGASGGHKETRPSSIEESKVIDVSSTEDNDSDSSVSVVSRSDAEVGGTPPRISPGRPNLIYPSSSRTTAQRLRSPYEASSPEFKDRTVAKRQVRNLPASSKAQVRRLSEDELRTDLTVATETVSQMSDPEVSQHKRKRNTTDSAVIPVTKKNKSNVVLSENANGQHPDVSSSHHSRSLKSSKVGQSSTLNKSKHQASPSVKVTKPASLHEVPSRFPLCRGVDLDSLSEQSLRELGRKLGLSGI